MNMIYVGTLIKRGDRLQYLSNDGEKKYKDFTASIPPGAKVEMYMEAYQDNGLLTQLAKIHAIIKGIASHTGNSVEGIKLTIKDAAGLHIERSTKGLEYSKFKSFADCSTEELNVAINESLALAERVGLTIPK